MPKNIYQRNDIYWARFKIAGRTYRQSLYVRVEPAKRAETKAVRALERLRSQVEDEVRHGIVAPHLWQDAVIAWNDVAIGLVAHETHKRYLVSLNQCRAWLDDKLVHQIDLACLRELMKARRGQGVTNATIRRDLTAISSVLANAQDEGWVEINHAQAINRKRIPERRDPIVLPTDEAISAMVQGLLPRLADIVEFALETGMRQDEIVRLEWDCLDLRSGVATIHKTKGSKVRAVPLSDYAIEIIRRQPKYISSKIVFWREAGKPWEWSSSEFGAVARKVSRTNSHFTRFRFHDLRHLFAVRYLRKSGSIYLLQGILGHVSIKTTEVYLAFITPEQQQASRMGVAQIETQNQRLGDQK